MTMSTSPRSIAGRALLMFGTLIAMSAMVACAPDQSSTGPGAPPRTSASSTPTATMHAATTADHGLRGTWTLSHLSAWPIVADAAHATSLSLVIDSASQYFAVSADGTTYDRGHVRQTASGSTHFLSDMEPSDTTEDLATSRVTHRGAYLLIGSGLLIYARDPQPAADASPDTANDALLDSLRSVRSRRRAALLARDGQRVGADLP